ncbi:MAG: penicillin-binding protein 2 [Candidatus Levybacteria bacterium]|nr:penicillin-binding protein 2 [Candidatus Levybacteria bacterium]
MILRYRTVLLIFTLVFGVIILRLFYWQVVKASELSKLGQIQYGQSIKIEPIRGEIETSDHFPIAANKISYIVFANPKEIKNKEETIKILSQRLDLNQASVSAQLSLDLFWVPLARGVDSGLRSEIEKANIPGVGFEQEFERLYPEASMAANLLGFVGRDEGGSSKGYSGLEGYWDRLLRGKEGSAVQIRDAIGRPILARVNSDEPFGTDGSSLILHLERGLQFLAEKKLKEGVERYGASGGMVGIMDPKTGAILAMANFPSFDPQEYSKYSDDLYKNSFISNLYEPGSTFKPLVVSAAFNEKLLTPTSRCPICTGPISVGGYDLHTWNDEYYPNSTMLEVIQHSDNIGMVYVARKLGVERMTKYLDKFGIGELTGIDLEGESVPHIKPENLWYEADLATAGFGQGISVTPIELLTAFSSIANKGVMMEPHVVAAVKDENGKITKIPPKEIGRPISEATAKVMTEVLVNAVSKGEAKWAKIPGYRVAGKTGTASIPIEGKYDPNKTIASFIGFAPVDEPKFAMLVILDRPTARIYGAETAAPVFFSIARDLLTHFGIPPDE